MGTSRYHKVGHVKKKADEHALASVKVLQEAGNVPVKLLLLMNCSNKAALLKAIKQSLIELIVSQVCTKPHAGPLAGTATAAFRHMCHQKQKYHSYC